MNSPLMFKCKGTGTGKYLFACAVSSALAFLIGVSALAQEFPGTGSRNDWGDALPYYNLANKYLAKERFEDARQKYEEAIARYQYDPDFYINLGVACRKLGDFPKAEEAYKKAIELSPQDWTPWSDLANIYLKQDRLKDTLAAFQQTLKRNPPASEKAAIQKDIQDINKILKMQAPLAARPKPSTVSPGKGGSGKAQDSSNLAPKRLTNGWEDVAK